MQINNGDVFDLGQTINGVSTFLWFNDKWYYFVGRITREYEYPQQDLTDLVTKNEFEEIKFVANILQTVENYFEEIKWVPNILNTPKIHLSEIEIDAFIEGIDDFMTGYIIAKNKYKK